METMLFKKQRLAVAIVVYWILLAYIITGLGWWFIALQKANRESSARQLEQLKPDEPHYADRRQAILAAEKKMTARNVGEGSTYVALILVGAIFVYREVRRQIRLQLQQQNFMMAVTHELKTPIAVTKLNLETLLKHKLDESRQQKIIQAALQEANRLDSLANNILIASQLEGGDYIRQKESVDLSALAQRTLQDYRHRFPDRKWEEHIEPDASAPGDPMLLQLLLSNLVDNAIKYSPKEGSITIRVERKGKQVMLAVADQGQGVPEEEKRKIFAKFYRTGQEATRQTKGTGLGLYLCLKIAEDHRATLKVTDNSPIGSIFTVVLPSI